MSPLRKLKASEIMTEHVVTARPDDSIASVASQMERRKIGSVVIVQNRRVAGIITERDFARIVKQGITGGRDRAKHHMTKPVVTVRLDTSVSDVIKLMRKKHVRHVPVLNRSRRLIGMITLRDVVKASSEVLSIYSN